MILTVTGSYIRHGDQAHCTLDGDIEVGTLKEAWGKCHAPGHRLWRLEVHTVDGQQFAEWHKDNPIPVRWPTVDAPKPSKRKK